jgi:hypothetical protein
MANITASWVHGNAVVAEKPPVEDGGLLDFNHFGWGTQIVMRPGFVRWFHIFIPSPVLVDGNRAKLIRVFLQWQQVRGEPKTAYIQDAHLWDGGNKVAMKSQNDFMQDDFLVLQGNDTYELRSPVEWYFGVGLSFRLGALPMVKHGWVDNKNAPMIVISSAGADFEF